MAERAVIDPYHGSNAINQLRRELGGIPVELRRLLRKRLPGLAEPMLADARRRSSWSTRIPNSLRIKVSFAKRRGGVLLVADRRRAPHARPFEGVTGRTFFRHPVYGRDVWVRQRTRPFLGPAVDARLLTLVTEINKLADQVARDAGFR